MIQALPMPFARRELLDSALTYLDGSENRLNEVFATALQGARVTDAAMLFVDAPLVVLNPTSSACVRNRSDSVMVAGRSRRTRRISPARVSPASGSTTWWSSVWSTAVDEAMT
jgi:hypothetical protein